MRWVQLWWIADLGDEPVGASGVVGGAAGLRGVTVVTATLGG